jgi:putative DNA primase/helicase
MSREESFRAAMNAHGIEYSGELYFDGRLHRFKANGDNARNSWFVLYNGPIAVGTFGCWKRGIKETWCERNGNLSLTESQQIRERWEQADTKVKAETALRQKKARKISAWILNRSRPARTLHRYLSRKRAKIFGDVREYRGALVVVPLRDLDGELHSLQFISEDGTKKFLTGGRMAGCFFTLADKAEGPLVLCEGYATGASIHEATVHAVICAMNSGNLMEVAKAMREFWPGREIIVAADNDQWTTEPPNPGLNKATAAAKAIRAKLAVPQFKDIADKPTDFNDLAIAEGLDAVEQQIGAAEVPRETDADTYARLAALSPAEYDRCRETEAAALRIRVKTLDAEVEQRRRWTGGNDSTVQGRQIDLPETEPWPDPVDGAEVLDTIAKRHRAYVALPDYAADVCALWEAHSHCFEVFDISARLCVTSPEKGCGKTTLLDVIALFVPRPLSTENLTAAVLFRLIETRKPTVLADEYDSWLRDNEELRGLFNAGHRRGGKALRCEGDNHEVRAFGVYGPAVLCGIGALPGTLRDRSIVIRLERAKPNEIRKRFDSRHTEYERELCRKLARWCAENRPRLEACDPKMPDRAFNRLADNWRLLFAIAEIAGGDWPARTAAAFDKLTRREDSEAEGLGVMLLADIQQIFAGTSPPPPDGEKPSGVERIFSRRLVELLSEMKDRPWPEAQRGKPISERWIARYLAAFEIHSKTLRIGDERAKGYEAADFTEAFERYIAPPGEFIRDSVTHEGKLPFSIRDGLGNVTDEKTAGTEGMSRCHAFKTPADTPVRTRKDDHEVSDDAETLIGDELGVARL